MLFTVKYTFNFEKNLQILPFIKNVREESNSIIFFFGPVHVLRHTHIEWGAMTEIIQLPLAFLLLFFSTMNAFRQVCP